MKQNVLCPYTDNNDTWEFYQYTPWGSGKDLCSSSSLGPDLGHKLLESVAASEAELELVGLVELVEAASASIEPGAELGTEPGAGPSGVAEVPEAFA